tara:strand:- start:239 stop:556 length:318 start_codon:yes stop_codon:yes gene_type:complete
VNNSHKLYNCLKKSLQEREEWICNVLMYFKGKQIAREAKIMLFRDKPLTYLFVNFINLPSNILRFFREMDNYYHYIRIKNEISLIKKEINILESTNYGKKIDWKK